jgi:hypothetical protein
MQLRYIKFSSKDKLPLDWQSQNFNRTALLNFIVAVHKKNIDCKYLEIGCASNINFNSLSLLDKTGVDPDIGGTLRLTSDEFFEEFNKQKFDLIFLDGLHTYEQTKKDLLNSLNVLNEGGVIVLDDFLPRDWKEEFTPRVQSNWNGDIWKIAFELIDSNGINFKILSIDGGQCILFKSESKYSIPNYYEEFKNLSFQYLYENYYKIPVIDLKEGLNWIKNQTN